MIQSKIVADSIDKRGNRITSILCTYPRIIHSEIMTHRMLSKNSASSRAIPFNKMVQSVQENPFVPIAWQKEHKGMQGTEYFTNEIEINYLVKSWLVSRDNAIDAAKSLTRGFENVEGVYGITKQLANRLLEPFMYHTVLITGTDDGWNNFFELRCPSYEWEYETGIIKAKSKEEFLNMFLERYPTNGEYDLIESYKFTNEDLEPINSLYWYNINKGQAEIHMMVLAEAIYDSFNESTPKLLNENQWHIPFDNQIDEEICKNILADNMKQRGEDYSALEFDKWREYIDFKKIQISTAMSARTSYTVVGDEKEISYDKLISIHDKCKQEKHSSVFEHCTRVMSDEEYITFIKGNSNDELLEKGKYLFKDNSRGWCRNYRGFIQYRHILENKNN